MEVCSPNTFKIFSQYLFICLLLVACGGSTQSPVGSTQLPVPAVQSTGTPLSTVVANTPITNNTPSSLTIFYTNDEHGWMEGMMPGEGAAHLMGLWREAGYQPDSSFLILSGGDMWTGPAISTWFEGQSMVEVMNSMGYAATAVGNHEFDFGLDALRLRAEESTFPLLSANIRSKQDNSFPTDLGIQPYTIVTANDIQVGIIGLTTTSTPVTTNPVNVADFEFIDYETALREVVPQVKAAGAELILVPGHICRDELETLARQVADLGIHMLGGGHCNELFAEEQHGMVLLTGGYHFTAYAYATFQFDTTTDTVLDVTYGVRPNSGGTADPAIESIVMAWQAEAAQELEVVIGYTEGIARRSPEMQALITQAWLVGYPTADIAITNLGGMRAALPPGDITLADVIGVMPFNNVLIELHLTGEQLLTTLDIAEEEAAIGGIHRQGAFWVLDRTDERVDRDQTYSVLVNDFMYAGGDDYHFLAVFDPNGYNTAIDWRQPVIDWITAQNSSQENPIR